MWAYVRTGLFLRALLFAGSAVQGSARACDGIHREWVGSARGRHSVHGGAESDLRVHPR